jgi:hypothetical protein
MVAAIIDEGRRAFVINLRLRIVDLRCGGGQRHKGARLSDVAGVRPREVVGVTAGAERSFRLFAGRGSSSLVSPSVVIVIDFCEWWVNTKEDYFEGGDADL